MKHISVVIDTHSVGSIYLENPNAAYDLQTTCWQNQKDSYVLIWLSLIFVYRENKTKKKADNCNVFSYFYVQIIMTL